MTNTALSLAPENAASANQTQTAAPLRSITQIIADLSKPVDARRLRQRTQGGKTLTYIPWFEAVKILDHFAPGWSYEVRSVAQLGEAVAVTVRITIPALEGLIFREATGYEPLEVKGYGDPTSNSESMALRRAAAKFGLCLSLYAK